jgi:hypothetical protein
MKTPDPTKFPIRGRLLFTAFSALVMLSAPRISYSQCAAAPVAAAACSGGNGAASSGVNINGGNTYWFSGGPSTFGSITLNSGGTLRVCGTLTLSSMTYNGGTIIVESGGNLTINATMTVSGVTIINRGSLTIKGSLTLQGSNNAIYNDLSTSVLTLSGAGAGVLTLNGTTSFVINRGLITANKLIIQGTTGAVCMQNNAILSLTELDNNFTNSISYSGSGAAACLNVSTTAALNNDVTSSSSIKVCTSATSTGGAAGDASHGWGSAAVTHACSSCAVVLALDITGLTATRLGGAVQLDWTTGQNTTGNEVYYAEKSADGVHFNTFATLAGHAGQVSYSLSDKDITGPKTYYRIRAIGPSGASGYSAIIVVETGVMGSFQMYPNPVGPNAAVTLVIPSLLNVPAKISLVDMAGQVLRARPVMLSAGNNTLVYDVHGLTAGMYVVRIEMGAGGNLYSKMTVHGN